MGLDACRIGNRHVHVWPAICLREAIFGWSENVGLKISNIRTALVNTDLSIYGSAGLSYGPAGLYIWNTDLYCGCRLG